MIHFPLLGLLLILALSVITSPAFAEEPLVRLRPLPETEWSPDIQRLLGEIRDRVATLEGASSTMSDHSTRKTLDILRTLAPHSKLLGPFLGSETALGPNGSLPPPGSVLLALRTS